MGEREKWPVGHLPSLGGFVGEGKQNEPKRQAKMLGGKMGEGTNWVEDDAFPATNIFVRRNCKAKMKDG